MRCALTTALLFTACASGVGVEAPAVPTPDAPGDCPSTRAALESTRASLREGALGDLVPVANEILIDDGGLRVLVPGLRQLATEVPPQEIFSLSAGYQQNEGLARLRPHVIRVLEYFAGESAFIPGEHYAPLDATHRIATECDVVDTLSAVRALLELEVAFQGEQIGWLDLLFDAIVLLAEDPTFLALVEGIEFSDDANPDQLSVGREAFVLIARLLTENLGNPDFEIDALRPLVQDVFLSQLEGEGAEATRANVNGLLDLLELGFTADDTTFPQLQLLIQCVNDEDSEGEIAGMLFDYLSVDELSLPEFLADLDTLGEDDAGVSLAILLVDGTRALEQNPNLTRDMLAVVARFIAPDVSRQTVPATRRLQGTGVVGEILGFVEAIFGGGCRDAT